MCVEIENLSRLFTTIYVSPNTNLNKPWLIIGDFNDIRDDNEKKGSVSLNVSKCNQFNDLINDYS